MAKYILKWLENKSKVARNPLELNVNWGEIIYCFANQAGAIQDMWSFNTI